MLQIAQNPKYQKLLVDEIDKCRVEADGLISYENLKDLKWLSAILKESIRMDPAVSSTFWY